MLFGQMSGDLFLCFSQSARLRNDLVRTNLINTKEFKNGGNLEFQPL
jgi:hypothetical protein